MAISLDEMANAKAGINKIFVKLFLLKTDLPLIKVNGARGILLQ